MNRFPPMLCDTEGCDFETYKFRNGKWLCRTCHDELTKYL